MSSTPETGSRSRGTLCLFANTDWYLLNFRIALAESARDAGWDVLTISPPGPHADKIRQRGFRWYPIPMTRRSIGILDQTRAVRAIRAILREHRVDVLHNFTLKCAILGAAAARPLRDVHVVNAIAGMGYTFSSNDWFARALRSPLKFMLRRACSGPRTWTITQNPDDERELAENRICDAARLVSIPGSGVDCDAFRPPDEAGREPDPARGKRILFVGRILRDKGIYELTEACRTLQRRGLEFEMLIAGEPDPGNPASIPTSQLDAWAEEGLFRRLGHVSDMASLYQQAETVVLPSYREGLPKSLIEAAASGCALLSCDVQGCREVVTHEETGLLVPARDSSTLAEAMARLLGDEALRARLGRAARERAIDKFSGRVVNGATLAIYDRCALRSG
ncbi:MAG: glycosyltransferase family 4 protein [Planctomycetota bacterium]|nr:glycosyltransferase family 4 protein [Planctomycetota bacterium]MDA0934509.1 glycosyltransferase family 4 protein [Planctomycetota bacterium]